MARGKDQPALRAVEVQDYERPLYKTYRPSPMAHSSHLHISSSPSPSLLPPSAARHLRRPRKDRNGDGPRTDPAVERMLSPSFARSAEMGTAEALARAHRRSDSSDVHGEAARRSGMMRHASVISGGTDARSTVSGESGRRDAAGERERERDRDGKTHRRKSRLVRARRRDSSSSGTKEELRGVYQDDRGHIHDGEYDPFETVRTKSLRKVVKTQAFGAARADGDSGSEVGSVGSRSNVGAGGAGAGPSGGWAGWAGTAGVSFGVDEEERARRRRVEEKRQLEIDVGRAKSYDAASAAGRRPLEVAADDDAASDDENVRGSQLGAGKSGQTWSEYDSGYAATSPGPSHMSPPATAATMPDGLRPISGASIGASEYTQFPRHQPLSMTAGKGYLVDHEEHARQLLFPDEPAPTSANRRQSSRQVRDDSPLRPPAPPFANEGRPKARRTDSLGSIDAMSGRKVAPPQAAHMSSHPSKARGETSSKPGSQVFDPQEYGYLPTRWADGDHELRLGEEAREKYRPREWQPTHSANAKNTSDFAPSCGDSIKRNWHEFCLSLRFSTHRTKKKLERKLAM